MKSIQQYLFEVSDETLKSAISKADAKINDPKTDNAHRRVLRTQKREFEKYLKSDEHQKRVKVEEILKKGTVKPTNKSELIKDIIALLKYGQNDLDIIDISEIDDLSTVFSVADEYVKISNIDISKWDVSNVKVMDYMFSGCDCFNSDLSKWDVSNVSNSKEAFLWCQLKQEYRPKLR